MSKRKKVHSKKEEQKAEKVVKFVLASLIALAILLLVGFSIFS
ncbi:hypothetical protein EZS27_018553 [termite gut metagenome]|jgi:hypothetical protein|uniref:DUF4044 domain-containing protein n=1 Tax=termite gut metagenome TaxID=433724 RepID=A0A5J4RH77_9ZZZZ